MNQVPAVRDVLGELWRDQNVGHFPPRVVAAIRRQENSAEILVKLIQLTVVGIWAGLYLVAPKSDTMFAPVPIALIGYLLLNVIGLVWALRSGLPNWAVYVNVLIDVSMLFVLIWSFHLQYGQPPAFYLKAPTLLYIFIFIAVRALRFQARFVIAAGLAAAAGWTAMTVYAVVAGGGSKTITRNYVDYLTSNSVLLGAEIDKIIAIPLVSGIIALALVRGRLLLVEAVSQGTAARDLSRFFDEKVATRIRSADQVAVSGEGVRRDAAILFVDIRGFSTLAARMDAPDVVAMLTAYERRIVPVIQAHGGAIDKFLGDGIMASFGALAESDTHAADALRAIDAIMAETADWDSHPEFARLQPGAINATVASGPVVFGALGGENRLEYTSIGAAVNLAAKLEKHNKQAGSRAITDAVTWHAALSQGYVSSPRARTVSQSLVALGESLDLVILYENQPAPVPATSPPPGDRR